MEKKGDPRPGALVIRQASRGEVPWLGRRKGSGRSGLSGLCQILPEVDISRSQMGDVGYKTLVRAPSASGGATGDWGTWAWRTPGFTLKGNYGLFITFVPGKQCHPPQPGLQLASVPLYKLCAWLSAARLRAQEEPCCLGVGRCCQPRPPQRIPLAENPPFLMGSGGWDAIPSPSGFWAKTSTTCR